MEMEVTTTQERKINSSPPATMEEDATMTSEVQKESQERNSVVMSDTVMEQREQGNLSKGYPKQVAQHSWGLSEESLPEHLAHRDFFQGFFDDYDETDLS